MRKLTSRNKLEIGAYLVTLALAIPSYVWAVNAGDTPWRDFLINISATFAGAGFLFFLLNRFFGLDSTTNFGSGEIAAESFFRDDLPDMRERLRSAKTIAVSGMTLSGSSGTYRKELKDCLERGGEVRVVILDPNQPAVDVAANRYSKHQNVNKLRKECEHALGNFETLLKRNGKLEPIQIRSCNAVPPYGIWLIDADSRNAEIWVKIYPYRGDITPAFQLLPRKDGDWFEFFQEQFELLWKNSADWNSSQ